MTARGLILLFPFVLLSLTGCGGGPRVVNVTGTVKRHGKPVEKLFLNFVPEMGRPSWGVTDSEGRFALHYERGRDGALVGSHQVWVDFRPASPQEEQALARGTLKFHSEMPQILKKYGKNNTLLAVEIKEENQVVDLVLD
jgi:hypothetical protein